MSFFPPLPSYPPPPPPIPRCLALNALRTLAPVQSTQVGQFDCVPLVPIHALQAGKRVKWALLPQNLLRKSLWREATTVSLQKQSLQSLGGARSSPGVFPLNALAGPPSPVSRSPDVSNSGFRRLARRRFSRKRKRHCSLQIIPKGSRPRAQARRPGPHATRAPAGRGQDRGRSGQDPGRGGREGRGGGRGAPAPPTAGGRAGGTEPPARGTWGA